MNTFKVFLAILFIISCFSVAVHAQKQEPANDGQFCDICTYVVQLAEHYANQSEPQIEQALLSACSKLPTTLGNMCNTVVLIYGHQIIDFILKEENPQRVCCQIHLCANNCTSKAEALPIVPAPLRANDGMCDLCTFAVTQVESFLAQNQTEQEIVSSLRLVCSMIPSTFTQQCQEIVEKYVPSIIYYLESEFPPAAVCQMIGLCEKKSLPVTVPKKDSNDANCDLCKFGVAQIEEWLATNETETVIQQRLALVCSLLPGVFHDECLNLVQQVPQIITYLEQTYTPQVICQLIGVCSSKKITEPVVDKVQDGECSLCTFAVGQIEAWVASNQTEKNIQQRLTLVCNLLPLFKDECLSLVDQVPNIIQELEQSYTPQVICQKLGLCSSKTKKIAPKPVKKVSNDGSCSLCEFGVGQIEAWLASNQTESVIQKRLSMICNLLPGGFKDECFSLVNQVPQIITYLEQSYTPEVVCQMIGVCSSKTRANSATCAICKFGVSQVEAWIAEKGTQEFIQHKLGMVCGLLPVFKDQCLQLVDQVPSIIQQLEQAYTPDVICQIINVCPSKDRIVKKSNDASCDLCKFGVAQIEAWLASNDTENIIQQRLALVCSLLPGDFKDQCLSLVQQVPEIITWLESAYTPEAVCQILGICPTDGAVIAPKKSNDGSCSLCEFGVGQIEAWLASNQTEAVIQKRLGMICNLLPGGFKDECFSLVNQVPQIITWLESAYTPEAVCQLLGICPTNAIVQKKSNDGECALCTFAVGQIEAWVASNTTVKAIQQKLTLVCNMLPVFQDECLSLVDQVPSIIQQLEQQYTPDAICQKIGLCSSKKIVAVAKPKDGECFMCKFGVSQIQAWLASNATEQFIQQRLGLICNMLPAFKGECSSLVEQVPQVISYIEQTYTPDVICQLIGVCTSKKVVVDKKSNDGNCELCKFGVGQIEAWLAANQTQSAIQQRLTVVCNQLSGIFKTECVNLVAQVPQIITYLEQTYTPEVICQLLGICSSKKVADTNSNDGSCSLCQFGVGQIEAWLASNETEARIQQRLSLVCNMLPALKDECLNLVQQVPQIVTYLEQIYTPEVICQLIGVCTSKKALPVASKAEKVHADILCPACMFVVQLIEQEVKANHTVADVEKALEKVCHKLPHPFSDACSSIVEGYTPQIVELITKKLDPSAICTAIKLCKKRHVAVLTPQLLSLLKAKDSKYCPLCLQITGFVESQITSQATTEMVISALNAACDNVPSNFQALCKQVVPAAYQEFIKFALEHEPPKVICQQLQMCSKNEIMAVTQPKSNNMVCAGCKQLVALADNFITQESTKQEITAVVENVCNYVPQGYSDMCKAVIEQYGPGLIEQLASKVLEPSRVCAAVGACSSGIKKITRQNAIMIKLN